MRMVSHFSSRIFLFRCRITSPHIIELVAVWHVVSRHVVSALLLPLATLLIVPRCRWAVSTGALNLRACDLWALSGSRSLGRCVFCF